MSTLHDIIARKDRVIQALTEELSQLRAEIEALKAEIKRLEQELFNYGFEGML